VYNVNGGIPEKIFDELRFGLAGGKGAVWVVREGRNGIYCSKNTERKKEMVRKVKKVKARQEGRKTKRYKNIRTKK
jgi:hypothetical protein